MVFKPLEKRCLNMVSVSVIFVKCHLRVIIYFTVLHDIPVSNQPPVIASDHPHIQTNVRIYRSFGLKTTCEDEKDLERCVKAKLPFPHMFVDTESFT